MEKIRILYLITGLNPGGAEVMLKNIIKNLNKDGYEISVCTITDVGIISKAIRPYVKGIYFLNANNLYNKAKAVFRLRKLIKKINPHFLHCFMVHSNLLGRFAAIGLKCEVISSIRVKLVAKKYLPLLILDFLTQKFVNCYIVNSKTLYNFTIKLGIKKQKIILIENGIEVNKFRPKKSPEILKKELGLSDLPIISMIAHLRKQKDYPTMIKALNYLQEEMDFHFLAVGADTKNENIVEKVKQLIKKYNLENFVKLLGIRTDIPDILSITDIWVSSTLFEGQSNSLLEAMVMKKPIITTNILENAEVVRDGKEALLIPVKSPKDLANAIKRLIKNKDLSNRIAENAYNRVVKNYNIELTMNKLDDLYHSRNSKMFTMNTITSSSESLKEKVFDYLYIFNSFLDKNRFFKLLVSSIYDRVFLLQEKLKMKSYKKRPNQKNIIYINPKKIHYRQNTDYFNFKKDQNIYRVRFIEPLFGFVFKNKSRIFDGDWDQLENLKIVTELVHYTSFHQHFKKNVPWEETQYYKLQLEKISEGSLYYYNSKEDLNLKFKNFDELYENIKMYGYKSQKELIQLYGFYDKMGRYSKIRKIDDEVSIAIGRDGKPILFDGVHRLVIALLLSIKKIPVNVNILHSEWVKKKSFK